MKVTGVLPIQAVFAENRRKMILGCSFPASSGETGSKESNFAPIGAETANSGDSAFGNTPYR